MLLLLSAGLIAGIAALLLSRERERLGDRAREAELGRLRNSAEQIALAVSAVQNQLMRDLQAIPTDNLIPALREWERSNPLVRNVFVWQEPGTMLLPDTSLPLTREEQGFLGRYRTLFDNIHGWFDVEPNVRQDSSISLNLISKSNAFSPLPRGKWIHWYWENQLGMIAGIDRDGLCYGVEMEVIALLAELPPAMPANVPANALVVLLDDSGRRILQSGSLVLEEDAQPTLSVPIGSLLPHWEMALYTKNGIAGKDGTGYFVLSGLLVAILFALLFGAGLLLLREAHRNRLDAQLKTSFVANVSHELKTPLTTIRMYADLLREGRVGDEEKRNRYFKTIASESERLTRLVNNVLDFGRLEQNRKKYRIDRFDLREAVEETVQAQRLRIGEAGMELAVALPNAEVPVQTDRDAIQQALLNLIDNAVKYAASGGTLRIAVEQTGNRCTIAVTDAGPGIDPAFRKKIFDRFFRIDDSITAKSQGCGLGLGLSRRLLTDLGGSLEYRPAPGGGACFTITLPGANKP